MNTIRPVTSGSTVISSIPKSPTTKAGGCVTGGPGKLAAQRILRDRERATG